MIDIVQEILSEELTNPPSLTRACAEAAMKLYQEAAQVCGRFDLPMSSIYTEVWTTGTPKTQSKAVRTSQLWFASETGHFVNRSDIPAPRGPNMPFGASWLMLEDQPARIRSRKERGKELYKVLVAYWEHRAPLPGKGDPRKLPRPEWTVKWSYAKAKPRTLWYKGEQGERCDDCKEEVWDEQVAIEWGHILRCRGCYRKAHPNRLEFQSPGQTDPSYRILLQEVNIAAGLEVSIPVPAYARSVRFTTLCAGDTVEQRDEGGAPIQQHMLTSGIFVCSIAPKTTTLVYSSVMGGRLAMEFEIQETPKITMGLLNPNAPSVNVGGQWSNYPPEAREGPFRTRRSDLRLQPPSPQTAGGLDALLRDFRGLSPLGKAVTLGLGAMALKALMPPSTTTSQALDFDSPLLSPQNKDKK